MIRTENNGDIYVEEFNLADFLRTVETIIRAGTHKFDFETNEGYPVSYGFTHVAVLRLIEPQSGDDPQSEAKAEAEEVVQESTQEAPIQEEAPKKSAGRPKKSVE